MKDRWRSTSDALSSFNGKQIWREQSRTVSKRNPDLTKETGKGELALCHLKITNKSVKSETLKLFVFFFALAGERIFIKMHSIEIRLYRTGVYIYIHVQASLCIFQRGNFTGWGSEGVNIHVQASLCVFQRGNFTGWGSEGVNIHVQASLCVFQRGNFTGWGSEGVNIHVQASLCVFQRGNFTGWGSEGVNIHVQASLCVFQRGNFTGWGSEGVNINYLR